MRIITILFLSILPIVGFSQSTLSTKSKKAADDYYQADNYRVRGQYDIAIDLLRQAINKDAKFHEAYFRLGTILKAKGELDEAEKLLLHADELSGGKSAGSKFELGELYLQKGEYEEAISSMDEFLQLGPRNSARINEAKKIISDARFALDNMEMAAELNPQPLSDIVNSFPMQYFPVVTVDQQSLIFTRRLGTTMNDHEDLVISRKTADGRWGKPESLSDNINTDGNEGTCTVSADGRTLIFTSCYGRQGYGSCDLYFSKKIGEEWTVPENLGPKVNSASWDSQPSLSADGRTLYFISNRNGGIGGRDIWVSNLDENNFWQKAVNLGKSINTMYDEVSPFIHPNNVTLYFASNGLTGFGGFDIFYTEKENDQWATPKNIGYPINTSEDQVSLFITSDGATGYYSHEALNNPAQKGILYQFNVPENAKVKYRTSYVFGQVMDVGTKTPLKAKIELFDLENEKREGLITSDSISGEYLMVLKEGSEYALYANKEGYLFESLSFNFEMKGQGEPVKIDIYLKPVVEGAKSVLNNIFFDVASYELKDKSKTELNKLVNFLRNNPGTKIEIGGHTDNTGSAEYNKELSLKRAKSVYHYLIEKSIEQKQLTFKGYGQTTPAFPNDTDKNKEMNRRIEFKIL